MKEQIIERCIRNATTSLIGLALIIFSGILVYMDKASVTEVSGWVTLGLTLIRAKDTLVGVKQTSNNEDNRELLKD